MKEKLMKKIVCLLLTMAILITHIAPNLGIVYAISSDTLPFGFSTVAIGNTEDTGSAVFDETNKVFKITGTGTTIGKDSGSTDSYQFTSYDITGDCTIIARLVDFDMSKAIYGQAGVFIRENNNTNDADYIGIYVEPSKNEYRYAFRDKQTSSTGAAVLSGVDAQSKEKYIKIEKVGTSCKLYIAEDAEFNNVIVAKGQTLTTKNDSWNVGFVVANGGNDEVATAEFDNVLIKDSKGLVYSSNGEVEEEKQEEMPELPELPVYEEGTLPKGFENSSIGNDSTNVYANFDEETKQFTVNGSGTYIGKDTNSTDNYQFVNYKVEGNATIIARLVDFDMSKASYGQAGVFIREDVTTNNADYFGVYVEPSKDQYRYAYRDNGIQKAGAAVIPNLTANSKNQYIKIEKTGNQFKYSISEDSTFPADKTISNTQTVTSNSKTWNVGFVVSNGGSSNPAVAKFDNVRIENENKVYYDSTLEIMPVETVENIEAVSGDSKVTLIWNEVEEATSYIVKKSTLKTGEFIEVAEVEENSYTDNEVVNFDTYYYKVTAKNDKGFAHDSKAVLATPNNSNPLNIQYEENAAVFNMTKEPNDTVSNSVITLEGSTNKDGSITIIQNGETKVKFDNKSANETFIQNLTLELGRNTIEIYHTTEDGKNTIKTYNIVYLQNKNYNKVVDKSYTGIDGEEVDGIPTYKTIEASISSIPKKNTERIVVFVKNGTYKEKLTIEAPYVSIVGEDSEKTIITYDDAHKTINPSTGEKYGTGKSASVTIKNKAVGFTAENVTIENAFEEIGEEGEQAVALNNQADKSIFVNCRFIANQDTLLADASGSSPARQYYYKCYIEGDVDFIFGRAQAVFDDCDIASVDKGLATNNGYITAADTWDTDSQGYLIINSRLIGLGNITEGSVSLGRPWRPSSQTRKMTPLVAYVNCYMGDHISTKGWDDMTLTSLAADSRFYEYGSYGPGAKTSDTRNILNNSQIINYTTTKVFAKDSATLENGNDGYVSDWMPTNLSSDININTAYGDIVTVESLQLNVSGLTIATGETTKLIATVNPQNSTNQTVLFESSDESIVTVDENGTIKALKPGSAQITAKCGNKQATCTITVVQKMIALNKIPEIKAEDVVLKVGDQFNEKANVTAIDYEDGELTNSIEVILNTVDTTKVGEYKVVYKVSDLGGATAVKEIKVTVNPVFTLINRAPQITAEDITIVQGQTFDPKANVSATDYEDGNLTEKIEVIENTVDTFEPGQYKIVYKVSDLKGATTIKPIVVTVEAKQIEVPVINTVSHNFTTDGLKSSVFQIIGKLSSTKGTVRYNGLELKDCLKLEKATNIKFTTKDKSNLTLVFSSNFNKKINIDGKEYTVKNGVLEVDLEGGNHTITKSNTGNIYYMELKSESGLELEPEVEVPGLDTKPEFGEMPEIGEKPEFGTKPEEEIEKPIQQGIVNHNFTTSGIKSEYFNIVGKLSSTKGTVKYNNLTLTQCLKVEKSTKISFSTTNKTKLTLVFNDNFNKKVKIDNFEYKVSNGKVEINLEAGNHTIVKGDTGNLYYIQLESNK